jgi:Spy/CpxP family protein refolding chaperone
MRHIRWMGGAVEGLILVAALGLTACDNGSSGGQAAPVASSASPAASAAAATPSASAAAASAEHVAESDSVNEDLRDYHRHHHHGGVTMFISMAIDTLGLDPAKKAQVEKIQSDLRAKMAPARDAEHDVLATIADGVAAGKIDTAKVDTAIGKVASVSANLHVATSDALTQLHDALAPAERAALVDKVKAHWEVWQNVNVAEQGGSKEKGSRLAKLTELLGLTPDQVETISKSLSAEVPATPQTDPKAVDAHIQAFATAFVGDKFDPKSLATTGTAAAGHVARHGGARMARFYEAVTPVLTPDQRTKLAADLRERLDDQHVASGK